MKMGSTVDPCSKLIRVKSRLDPSDVRSILNVCEISPLTYAVCVTLEMKIAGRWLSIHTATKNMCLVLLTTAVSTVHPKKRLKLRQSIWKIEALPTGRQVCGGWTRHLQTAWKNAFRFCIGYTESASFFWLCRSSSTVLPVIILTWFAYFCA